MKNIPIRIMSILSIVLVFAMISINLTTVKMNRDSFEKDFKNTSMQAAVSLNEALNVKIKGIEEQLKTLANSRDVKTLGTPQFSEAVIKANLAAYQKDHANFSMLYIGTEEGKMLLLPETELPSDYDPRIRPWYKSTMETDDVVWSETYFDAIENKPLITATKRIMVNGKIAGVLGVDLVLTDILDIVKQAKLGELGYFSVIDPQGTCILYPNQKLIGTILSQEPFMKTILQNEAGFEIYTSNGEIKQAVYVKNDPLKIKLIGIQPLKDLESKTIETQTMTFMSSAIGILLIGLLSAVAMMSFRK